MTAYYVPTMTETYTVTFHLDQDCANPLEDFRNDTLDTFSTGYGYDAVITDVSESDVWEWCESHRRDRDDRRFLVVGHGGEYGLADSWRNVRGIFTLADAAAYGDRDEQRKAASAILGEYSAWANGDCWGYVVTDSRGREVESLWGMIGHDWAKESALHDYPGATIVEGAW